MSAEQPDIDLELELTRLAQGMRRRSVQWLAALHPDLDYATYLYFLSICDAPGQVRGADLAARLGVHKSTASRAVSALVRLGLVEQRPDPSDGRARLLVPTDAAAATLRHHQDRSRRRLLAMLDGWESADVGLLARLLRRFNDDADGARPDRSAGIATPSVTRSGES